MKKKIEKEKREHTGEYIPVVRAVIVLLLLVLILVGVILYHPTKKAELEEPNTLPTDELIVSPDSTCDGEMATRVKSDADKVTLTYEVIDDYFFGYMAEQDEDLNGNGVIDEGEIIEDIGYALKVKLSNLTDNIYVVVSNDLDENIKIFHNTDVNDEGYITWTESETLFLRTYNIKVFSNNEKCTQEKYREFKVTLPKWNFEADSITCLMTQAKDLPECDKFIFDDLSRSDLDKKFDDAVKKQVKENKEKNSENKEEENEIKEKFDSIIDYLKKNPVVAVLGVIGLIVILALVVVIIKKGRK